MLKQLKVRRVKQVNKVNMIKTNKKLYVFMISMMAVISILFLSSSIGHSLEDLEMKIQYKTDQGDVQTWNLKDDYDFDQEWFTKKGKVHFTIDLSHYYDQELNEEVIPLEVEARHE